MQGLLITCLFLAIWKGLDTALNAYQLHLQAKIELARKSEPVAQEEGDDKGEIGFTSAGNTLQEIEEEDY